MYAFDAGANFDNFYAGGEYANFTVRRSASGLLAADNPNFSGWYVEGTWVLTGEPKSYTVSATNNEVGGFGRAEGCLALLAQRRLVGCVGTDRALQQHRPQLA